MVKVVSITRVGKSNADAGAAVWMTPQQAAKYMATSVSTISKLRCYGGGPAYSRIGHAVRYNRADLDAWLAKTRTT
jgi:excisionase family DNA binding protein